MRTAGAAAQFEVPSGGYSWWYADAIADDGRLALTAIFFVGSVFSPSYAARLSRGEAARAIDHVAVNLVVYERGKPALWVLSEYGAEDFVAAPPNVRVARSTLRYEGDKLIIDIDDRTAPFFWTVWGAGARVRGRITLEATQAGTDVAELAALDGHTHHWQLRAPRARVKVEFAQPQFDFEGVGYHDVNFGDGRLESAFHNWSWARFSGEGSVPTHVLYAVRDRAGVARSLWFDGERIVERAIVEAPKSPCGWGLAMPAVINVGELAAIPVALLDTSPFYARYLTELRRGEEVIGRGIGEYLDLDRFAKPAWRFLLNYKMRRAFFRRF